MTGRRTLRHILGAAGLIGLSLAGGCAEVSKGPRLVPYSDSSFYVRHVPLVTGAEAVDEVATERTRCAGRPEGRLPGRAVGIRYATYDCI